MRYLLNALILVAMATPAVAYDLRPSRVAKILKDETHELLSIASFECMKARLAAKSPPDVDSWNCLPDHMNFAYDYANDRWVPSLRGRALKDDPLGLEVQYLLAGVRWPDDPLGLARSNNPIRVTANFELCQGWLAGKYGPCGNRFCLSHFGHMQMAHSMKPSAPWCTDRNPGSSTCDIPKMNPKGAIEAWVRWLIPIGKGEVGPSTRVFANDSFAKKIFDQECDKVYAPALTYHSLFFSDCSKNPWYQVWNWGKSCQRIYPEEPEDELKARAVGAILHVIQDSYARGHTLRVAMSGSNWCSPRISCTKIKSFSDYTKQDSKKHGRADHTPIWDTSCFKEDRAVDDPITAGAKILAMFESSKYSENDIWNYLDESVFLVDNNLPTADELQREEACFGRD